MYFNKPYSIDDVVKYPPNRLYTNNLNYLISKSENYSNSTEINVIEYKGHVQKPFFYTKNSYSDTEKLVKTYYSQGRLVGINTMMAGPDVGLAVPVHVVKKFLKENLGSDGQPKEVATVYN